MREWARTTVITVAFLHDIPGDTPMTEFRLLPQCPTGVAEVVPPHLWSVDLLRRDQVVAFRTGVSGPRLLPSMFFR